jgi:hypothetical protein
MSSEESQRNRLPFEPAKKNRKKPAKNQPTTPSTAKAEGQAPSPRKLESSAVPEVVSKRMARRMALFCGIPSALGILTFIVSYVVVSQHWFKLPNAAVVLVSMGFFGLGVLGLSYGVLSASWDEERPGSKIGWNEFTTNWGRMTAAWRSAGQKDS